MGSHASEQGSIHSKDPRYRSHRYDHARAQTALAHFLITRSCDVTLCES